MTLANGLWTEDAVYIWSDTAFWEHATTPQRRIAHYGPKIMTGEEWPYALINSGTLEGMVAIAKALDKARPLDFWQLRETVLGALAGFVGKTGERTLIASFADKPRLTVIDTEEFGGNPPLTVMEARPWMIGSGAGRPEVMRLIEAGVTVDTMRDIIRAEHADWDHEAGALIAGSIVGVRVSRFGLEAFDVDELPDPTAIERVA